MARRLSPALLIVLGSIVFFNILTFGIPAFGNAITALSALMPAPLQGQPVVTSSFVGVLLGVGFSFFFILGKRRGSHTTPVGLPTSA